MTAKKDFIGRVMAGRSGLTDPDPPSLGGERLRAGGHLIPHGAQTIAANDQGYVTSVAFSPTLGHPIGLALLKRGPDRDSERVRFRSLSPASSRSATIIG